MNLKYKDVQDISEHRSKYIINIVGILLNVDINCMRKRCEHHNSEPKYL